MNAKAKYAFVSGSTSGIGLSVAKKLLKHDYDVWLNGRDAKKGYEVLAELKQEFSNVHFLVGDVSRDSEVKKINKMLQESGIELDLIVANVGTGRCSNELIVDLTEFQQIFNLNFFAAVNVCQNLEPLLRNGGGITCISSIAGVSPIGAPIPYACAKASLNMFVKEWAMRLASRKITVNAISPGNVLFAGGVWQKKLIEKDAATHAYIEDNVPMNKFVTPEEIASMVLQLEKQPSLTGQNLVIDAGQLRGAN